VLADFAHMKLHAQSSEDVENFIATNQEIDSQAYKIAQDPEVY